MKAILSYSTILVEVSIFLIYLILLNCNKCHFVLLKLIELQEKHDILKYSLMHTHMCTHTNTQKLIIRRSLETSIRTWFLTEALLLTCCMTLGKLLNLLGFTSSLYSRDLNTDIVLLYHGHYTFISWSLNSGTFDSIASIDHLCTTQIDCYHFKVILIGLIQSIQK